MSKSSSDSDEDDILNLSNVNIAFMDDPSALQEMDDEGVMNMRTLPPHACNYWYTPLQHLYSSGIHCTDSVVKCQGCSKWFCNSRGQTASSHIITHLVRAKHKEVCLHPESPLGYNCGCRNAFLLGFIPAKSDTVVVLLCRQPCASAPSKDSNWDLTQWQPLIEDRSFLTWLVKIPAEADTVRARHISSSNIVKLEEIWKEDPSATVEDLDRPEIHEDPNPVLLRYDDAYHYQNVMSPLIMMEAETDKKNKEVQGVHDVVVRWDTGLNTRKSAFFILTKLETGEVKLAIGDEIILRYKGELQEHWQGFGNVMKLPSSKLMHYHELSPGVSDEVGVEIRRYKKRVPIELSHNFSVELAWNSTSYDRMQAALQTFAIDQNSISNDIYHKILGHEFEPKAIKVKLPLVYTAPNLPDLNHSQIFAVKSVLQRPIALIQGPPGYTYYLGSLWVGLVKL